MKLNKKVYVYGVILLSSLALLASQALPAKTKPAARGPGPAFEPTPAEPSMSAPEPSPEPATPAIADPRVERLESSLTALQALLPADRRAELDALGRSWTSSALPAAAEPAPFELEPQPAPIEAEWGKQRALPSSAAQDSPANPAAAAPPRDPLTAWLTAHPLTAIAVGPARGVAAFGGELFGTGDELPDGLGRIARIEVRGVVISRAGVERRVPIAPLVPRANEPASAVPPPAPATRSAADPAPETNAGSAAEIQRLLQTLADPATGKTTPAPTTTPGSEHAPQDR